MNRGYKTTGYYCWIAGVLSTGILAVVLYGTWFQRMTNRELSACILSHEARYRTGMNMGKPKTLQVASILAEWGADEREALRIIVEVMAAVEREQTCYVDLGAEWETARYMVFEKSAGGFAWRLAPDRPDSGERIALRSTAAISDLFGDKTQRFRYALSAWRPVRFEVAQEIAELLGGSEGTRSVLTAALSTGYSLLEERGIDVADEPDIRNITVVYGDSPDGETIAQARGQIVVPQALAYLDAPLRADLVEVWVSACLSLQLSNVAGSTAMAQYILKEAVLSHRMSWQDSPELQEAALMSAAELMRGHGEMLLGNMLEELAYLKRLRRADRAGTQGMRMDALKRVAGELAALGTEEAYRALITFSARQRYPEIRWLADSVAALAQKLEYVRYDRASPGGFSRADYEIVFRHMAPVSVNDRWSLGDQSIQLWIQQFSRETRPVELYRAWLQSDNPELVRTVILLLWEHIDVQLEKGTSEVIGLLQEIATDRAMPAPLRTLAIDRIKAIYSGRSFSAGRSSGAQACRVQGASILDELSREAGVALRDPLVSIFHVLPINYMKDDFSPEMALVRLLVSLDFDDRAAAIHLINEHIYPFPGYIRRVREGSIEDVARKVHEIIRGLDSGEVLFDPRSPQHVRAGYCRLLRQNQALEPAERRIVPWAAYRYAVLKFSETGGQSRDHYEDEDIEKALPLLAAEGVMAAEDILVARERARELGLPLVVIENKTQGTYAVEPMREWLRTQDIEVIPVSVRSTGGQSVKNIQQQIPDAVYRRLQKGAVILVLDRSRSVINDEDSRHFPDAFTFMEPMLQRIMAGVRHWQSGWLAAAGQVLNRSDSDKTPVSNFNPHDIQGPAILRYQTAIANPALPEWATEAAAEITGTDPGGLRHIPGVWDQERKKSEQLLKERLFIVVDRSGPRLEPLFPQLVQEAFGRLWLGRGHRWPDQQGVLLPAGVSEVRDLLRQL